MMTHVWSHLPWISLPAVWWFQPVWTPGGRQQKDVQAVRFINLFQCSYSSTDKQPFSEHEVHCVCCHWTFIYIYHTLLQCGESCMLRSRVMTSLYLQTNECGCNKCSAAKKQRAAEIHSALFWLIQSNLYIWWHDDSCSLIWNACWDILTMWPWTGTELGPRTQSLNGPLSLSTVGELIVEMRQWKRKLDFSRFQMNCRRKLTN